MFINKIVITLATLLILSNFNSAQLSFSVLITHLSCSLSEHAQLSQSTVNKILADILFFFFFFAKVHSYELWKTCLWFHFQQAACSSPCLSQQPARRSICPLRQLWHVRFPRIPTGDLPIAAKLCNSGWILQPIIWLQNLYFMYRYEVLVTIHGSYHMFLSRNEAQFWKHFD